MYAPLLLCESCWCHPISSRGVLYTTFLYDLKAALTPLRQSGFISPSITLFSSTSSCNLIFSPFELLCRNLTTASMISAIRLMPAV